LNAIAERDSALNRKQKRIAILKFRKAAGLHGTAPAAFRLFI
jgi:hypothetical protein